MLIMQTESRFLSPKYLHKSLNYLFPLIGLGNRESLFPPSTFLWWNGQDSIENYRMMVFYSNEDVQNLAFSTFEKHALLKNPFYEKKCSFEDGVGYIFNLTSISDIVDNFVQGKYSKYPEGAKRKILLFYGSSIDKIPRPGRRIHMALYPELYHNLVAEEIGVAKLDGELCDPPNKDRETLPSKLKIEDKDTSESLQTNEKNEIK